MDEDEPGSPSITTHDRRRLTSAGGCSPAVSGSGSSLPRGPVSPGRPAPSASPWWCSAPRSGPCWPRSSAASSPSSTRSAALPSPAGGSSSRSRCSSRAAAAHPRRRCGREAAGVRARMVDTAGCRPTTDPVASAAGVGAARGSARTWGLAMTDDAAGDRVTGTLPSPAPARAPVAPPAARCWSPTGWSRSATRAPMRAPCSCVGRGSCGWVTTRRRPRRMRDA
jgi:hypothetical protein